MMTFCMISLGIFAQKAPKGKLISYSHTSDNPELPLHSEFSLDRNEGKGTLKIFEWLLLNEDGYTGEAGEDVFSRAADIIKEKKLYAIKKRKKATTSDPEQGSYSIVFEDKTINFESKDLSEEQHSHLSYLENFIKDAVKRIEPPTAASSDVAGRIRQYFPAQRQNTNTCLFGRGWLPNWPLARTVPRPVAIKRRDTL